MSTDQNHNLNQNQNLNLDLNLDLDLDLSLGDYIGEDVTADLFVDDDRHGSEHDGDEERARDEEQDGYRLSYTYQRNDEEQNDRRGEEERLEEEEESGQRLRTAVGGDEMAQKEIQRQHAKHLQMEILRQALHDLDADDENVVLGDVGSMVIWSPQERASLETVRMALDVADLDHVLTIRDITNTHNSSNNSSNHSDKDDEDCKTTVDDKLLYASTDRMGGIELRHVLAAHRQDESSLSMEELAKCAHILSPLLQQHLQRQVDDLAQFFAHGQRSVSPGDEVSVEAPTSATALAEAVAAEVEAADQDQLRLKELRAQCDEQLLQLTEVVQETVHVLSDTLEHHTLGQQRTHDQLAADFLCDRSATLRLKLGVLKHKLLQRTYPRQNVKALQKVRKLLEAQRAKVQQAHDRAKMELSEYEQAGMGFDELVREYAELQQQIKNKKWALSQMQ